jgi:hypothetical protein
VEAIDRAAGPIDGQALRDAVRRLGLAVSRRTARR